MSSRTTGITVSSVSAVLQDASHSVEVPHLSKDDEDVFDFNFIDNHPNEASLSKLSSEHPDQPPQLPSLAYVSTQNDTGDDDEGFATDFADFSGLGDPESALSIETLKIDPHVNPGSEHSQNEPRNISVFGEVPNSLNDSFEFGFEDEIRLTEMPVHEIRNQIIDESQATGENLSIVRKNDTSVAFTDHSENFNSVFDADFSSDMQTADSKPQELFVAENSEVLSKRNLEANLHESVIDQDYVDDTTCALLCLSDYSSYVRAMLAKR